MNDNNVPLQSLSIMVMLLLFCLGGRAYALGNLEGTFEYAIDAPWRLEPMKQGNSLEYGAIPIQMSIHDALEVADDFMFAGQYNVSRALSLGKVCRLTVAEAQGDKKVYEFDEFAEVESTRGLWPWPVTRVPQHKVCRAWAGENCASMQTLADTSEWHAVVWHEPVKETAPGSYLALTVTLELTRDASTSCDAAKQLEKHRFRASTGNTVLSRSLPNKLQLKNHLQVHFGEAPLPRFQDVGQEWLYGDLHYHSQGTDNEGESGYNYRGTLRAMGAAGIDFALATEHASNSEQIVDADLNVLDIDLWPPDIDLLGKALKGKVLRDMSKERFAALHGILHGSQGANREAVLSHVESVPQAVRDRGVLPQIYLGGELDALPEIAITDGTSVVYGNGLRYDIGKLCGGWESLLELGTDCNKNALYEDSVLTGSTLIRDVQGINELFYGREHMVYMPATSRLTLPSSPVYDAPPPASLCQMCVLGQSCTVTDCDTCKAAQSGNSGVVSCTVQQPNLVMPDDSLFIPSNTSDFGGATRRLSYWHEDQFPLLPELEKKGYAFLAHHLNAPGSPTPGPDGVPWSEHMLKQAWRSPAILGLEFWNENPRLGSRVKSQQSPNNDEGVETGYNRNDGFKGPKPVNTARDGFLSTSGLFELTPFDANTGRWGNAKVGIPSTLRHGAFSWDMINHWGLDLNKTAKLDWLGPGEPRRFFMAGGSDAHGDLNYRREGYLQGTDSANNTAIGSPRNLVKVARNKGTEVTSANLDAVRFPHESVVDALHRGEFLVTDGPVLRIVVDKNQNGKIDDQDIPMGGVLNLYGEKSLPLLVEWKSTPEFGAVEWIDLYLGVHNNGKGRTYAPYRHGPIRGVRTGLPNGNRHNGGQGTRHDELDDGYWHLTEVDTAEGTTRLRIAGGVKDTIYLCKQCQIICDAPKPPPPGDPDRPRPHPKFAELKSALLGQLKDETGCRTVCYDDVFCSRCGTLNREISCKKNGNEIPGEAIPLPSGQLEGMRAMTLNLSLFNASRFVHGDRFFVRAFARTRPKTIRTQHLNSVVRRYAFTNPIWSVTRDSAGECPLDRASLDRDQDGLPDGCDPQPDQAAQVDCSAKQSEVFVNTVTGQACGSLLGARHSGDNKQSVWCSLRAYKQSTRPSVVCTAVDREGQTLTCNSSVEAYVDAAAGLREGATIRFTATADKAGKNQCNALQVSNFVP